MYVLGLGQVLGKHRVGSCCTKLAQVMIQVPVFLPRKMRRTDKAKNLQFYLS